MTSFEIKGPGSSERLKLNIEPEYCGGLTVHVIKNNKRKQTVLGKGYIDYKRRILHTTGKTRLSVDSPEREGLFIDMVKGSDTVHVYSSRDSTPLPCDGVKLYSILGRETTP